MSSCADANCIFLLADGICLYGALMCYFVGQDAGNARRHSMGPLAAAGSSPPFDL